MFGFGYALVPFYEQICEAAGLRNIAVADEAINTQVDATRDVRIEFDSNVREPAVDVPARSSRSSTCIRAKSARWNYEVVNTTGRPMTGQAIPSYGPQRAARSISRRWIASASPSKRSRQARRAEMPVVFVVDPRAPPISPRSRCRIRSSKSKGAKSF